MHTVESETLEKLSRLPPDEIELACAGAAPSEAVRMLIAVLRGSMMGPGDGWFGPGQSRYSWAWLAARHGVAADGAISAARFVGPPELFERLDRNRDGQIRADDLDWSDGNSWVQQAYLIHRLFRRMNPTGSGRLTRADWLAFFDKAGGGQEHLGVEDLRNAVLEGTNGGFLPGDKPTQEALLSGLFSGSLGSPCEGPGLEERAPDFSLRTHDGTQLIHLADVVGGRPVVLVFGNFTCGPFRAMYQGADDVYQRFKDQATFLAVYVREAHPTDGWHMVSNDLVGVTAAQPKTYEERVAVAQRCHRLIDFSMPLLVDDVSDLTGHAYSGMPARLYVIDHNGTVTYKSGRGPFGFKVGEMEQALCMALLDGTDG